MFELLKEQFWRAWYRMHFFVDVPGIAQLLEFRKLRKAYYEALWRDAAASIGASATPWRSGYMRIERDGLATFVRGGEVMLDSHLMLDLMGDKAVTAQLLRERGAPVPHAMTCTVRNLEQALAFMTDLGGPVVVKPVSGTGGGRGVTTGVTDMASLGAAARLAARFDTELMIEKQVEGHSYRLLYLDGRFIDAVRRDAPVVVGDGRSTIRKLVAAENTRRLGEQPVRALSPLKIDRDCRNHLKTLGLKPSSRLAEGRVIDVKRAVNENCAARNRRVGASVHPDTIELGRRIVTELGVQFAGLDLLCRDISVPLDGGNGYINEVNTTPGIHHHYLVSEPRTAAPVAAPVASVVLDHLFAKKLGVVRCGPRVTRKQPRADNVRDLKPLELAS